MAGPKHNWIDPLADARAFGEVSFNYESRDGRYVIGVEPWNFELSLSAASHNSIHLYNDPPSIRGIAIAEGVRSIGSINPDVVARSDFTSRVRTPHVGQCVLIENQAGFFAAIEPISIVYSATPSENIVTMRYAIQRDGSSDFSKFVGVFNSSQSLADEIIRAADDAKIALLNVEVGERLAATGTGIGHNQPPPEYALSEEERSLTVAAVDVVRAELSSDVPSRDQLVVAARTIAGSAKVIALWMAAKLDLALDEFAKTVGKASAIAAVGGFAAWAALHGKLSILAQLLAAFHG